MKNLVDKIRSLITLAKTPRWSSRIGWAIVISIVVAILSFILLIKYPDWQKDIATIPDAKDRIAAESEITKTIAQIIGGSILFLSLYFTWRRVSAAERTAEASQEGQITERFTRAIEHLGDEKLEVRLGGIYALERISQDSDKDYWPIMEILTAFVRENANWPSQYSSKAEDEGQEIRSSESESDVEKEIPWLPTDIQAVLTVIIRRRMRYGNGETERLDLRSTNLGRANLGRWNLQGAILNSANLQRAFLAEVNLQGAYLERANLQGANLHQANLQGVFLTELNLQGANLRKANLQGIYLNRPNLQRANLYQANLQGANLSNTTGLTKEQLELALTDENTILPDYLNISEETQDENMASS